MLETLQNITQLKTTSLKFSFEVFYFCLFIMCFVYVGISHAIVLWLLSDCKII